VNDQMEDEGMCVKNGLVGQRLGRRLIEADPRGRLLNLVGSGKSSTECHVIQTSKRQLVLATPSLLNGLKGGSAIKIPSQDFTTADTESVNRRLLGSPGGHIFLTVVCDF
jgi:hypothetical protein